VDAALLVAAATSDNVGISETPEPPKRQTIFESISLEDIFYQRKKSVNLTGRHLDFNVKPSFTSGSTLVFNDDGSGCGDNDMLCCSTGI
jgi:hypothetical protein